MPDDELEIDFRVLAARWSDHVARQDAVNAEFRKDMRGDGGVNGAKGDIRDLKTRVKALEDAAAARTERGQWYWRTLILKGVAVSIIVYAGQKAIDWMVTHASVNP